MYSTGNFTQWSAPAAAAKSCQSCLTLCDPTGGQPTRLPCPWDSPGKNTAVGCHFLLQRMKVKSESEVARSCLTLSDSMDWSLPGSSVHGIFQARELKWGAIAFSNSVVYCDLNEKEIQKRGEICICITDSLCGTVETNTTL